MKRSPEGEAARKAINEWQGRAVLSIPEAALALKAGRYAHPVYCIKQQRADGTVKHRLVTAYHEGVNLVLAPVAVAPTPIYSVLLCALTSLWLYVCDLQAWYTQLGVATAYQIYFAIRWGAQVLIPNRLLYGSAQAPAHATVVLNSQILPDFISAGHTRAMLDDISCGASDKLTFKKTRN